MDCGTHFPCMQGNNEADYAESWRGACCIVLLLFWWSASMQLVLNYEYFSPESRRSFDLSLSSVFQYHDTDRNTLIMWSIDLSLSSVFQYHDIDRNTLIMWSIGFKWMQKPNMARRTIITALFSLSTYQQTKLACFSLFLNK